MYEIDIEFQFPIDNGSYPPDKVTLIFFNIEVIIQLSVELPKNGFAII